MKIILFSSIRGQNKQVRQAVEIITEELLKEDYTLYHEHVTHVSQEDLDNMDDKANLQFHREILRNLKKSDIVVAESSNQSLSVGYLISRAIELGKPAIIFYNHESPKPNLFPTLVKAESIFLVKYKDTTERITFGSSRISQSPAGRSLQFLYLPCHR